MSQSQTCKKCGEEKPIEEFVKHPKMKSGYRSSCKACEALRKRNEHKANPEKNKIRVSIYRANHLDEERERNRKYRSNNLEECRRRDRERKRAKAVLKKTNNPWAISEISST